MVWWILPIAVGLVGLVVTLTGLGRLFKLRLFSGTGRSVFGGLILACAAVLSLVGLNLQTYSRLTHERQVATVTLTERSEQLYDANITWTRDDTNQTYEISGDEIRFEARVLKWEPWANIVGYDAVYQLDRLSGRYEGSELERTGARSVHDLKPRAVVDIWALIRERGGWQSTVDAVYGNGVFVPMADGARYDVFMTQNGLIARPSNPIAETTIEEWR